MRVGSRDSYMPYRRRERRSTRAMMMMMMMMTATTPRRRERRDAGSSSSSASSCRVSSSSSSSLLRRRRRRNPMSLLLVLLLVPLAAIGGSAMGSASSSSGFVAVESPPSSRRGGAQGGPGVDVAVLARRRMAAAIRGRGGRGHYLLGTRTRLTESWGDVKHNDDAECFSRRQAGSLAPLRTGGTDLTEPRITCPNQVAAALLGALVMMVTTLGTATALPASAAASLLASPSSAGGTTLVVATEASSGTNVDVAASPPTTIRVIAPPTAKLDGSDPASKLFQQGRVLESQGNYEAALQIYQKVTAIRPNFVYGWSNLGNAQVVFQDLDGAEASYSTAIKLCRDLESAATATSGVDAPGGFMGIVGSPPKCDDLYVILLNRGCLRLNHNQPREALADLELSNSLRARPDAVILQNLARAKELNGNYVGANDDYDLAIQMTSNEVSPFWLRSALVKYQLGNVKGGWDLLKRVRNRFPDAPEVKAAYSVFLYSSATANNPQEAKAGSDDSSTIEARQLFLEIPDRARKQFSDDTYLRSTVGWPPAMIETLRAITKLVGDRP